MQYIFPLSKSTTTDHCEECGGEENEGLTGKLSPYLVVTLNRNGSVMSYAEKDVCKGCFEGIQSLSVPKKHSYIPPTHHCSSKDLGWTNNVFDWPFALTYKNQQLGRADAITAWCNDPFAGLGSVYSNGDNSIVLFVYAETP